MENNPVNVASLHDNELELDINVLLASESEEKKK
jgi:hypothetical protein